MKKERREEKRNRILSEAGKLFIANGIESTKIIDIAKASGMAKGTVYEYFESKDDIVIEWMSGTFEKFRSELMKKIECETDTLSKLKTFFEHSANAFSNIMINAKVLIHDKGIEKYSRFPPPIADSMEKAVEDKVVMLVIENLSKQHKLLKSIIYEGQREGRFRQDINVEIIPFFMMSILPFLGMSHNLDFPASYLKEKFELTGIEWTSEEVVNYIIDGIGKKS